MNSQTGQLLWHNDVHNRLGESLIILHFSTQNQFKRANIFQILDELFDESGIWTYSYWQIFGRDDVAIKAWTRNGSGFDLKTKLQMKLLEQNWIVQHSNIYRVTKTLYDEKWIDKSIKPLTIKNISTDDVESLSLPVILSTGLPSNQETESSLTSKGLCIRHEQPPGIKFFISVELNSTIEDHLEKILTGALIQKVHDFDRANDKIIHQIIDGASWMIEATAPWDDYLCIAKLTDTILEEFGDLFQVRTKTTLVSGPENHHKFFTGSPKPLSPSTNEDVRILLASPERENLEFKGSLFYGVENFIISGDKAKNAEGAINKIYGTIVAFLNSQTGGKLLIGAVEENRFGKIIEEKYNSVPKVSDMYVWGINWEYGNSKWDKYERDINMNLKNRISEGLGSLIQVSLRTIDDKELCLINVLPDWTRWHYLDNKKFYVRNGANTEELLGKHLDDYKNRNPRPRFPGNDNGNN